MPGDNEIVDSYVAYTAAEKEKSYRKSRVWGPKKKTNEGGHLNRREASHVFESLSAM